MADKLPPLEEFKNKVVENTTAALRESALIVFGKIRTNADLTDHTLADLAELGHPYAKRNPQQLHDPNYQVHIQTGALYHSIRIDQENETTYVVGPHANPPDYLDSVIFGTPLMVARDFVNESFNEVKDEINQVNEEAIKKSV